MRFSFLILFLIACICLACVNFWHHNMQAVTEEDEYAEAFSPLGPLFSSGRRLGYIARSTTGIELLKVRYAAVPSVILLNDTTCDTALYVGSYCQPETWGYTTCTPVGQLQDSTLFLLIR